MSETANQRLRRFEINPNATPQEILETSIALLAMGFDMPLPAEKWEAQRDVETALAHVPYLAKICLQVGVDPTAYDQELGNLLTHVNAANPADQELARVCTEIYAGQSDPSAEPVLSHPLTNKARRTLPLARQERLAYDGRHEDARRAAILGYPFPSDRRHVAVGLGLLSTWEQTLAAMGRSSEAHSTLRVAWQSIDGPYYDTDGPAAKKMPSVLIPADEPDDPLYNHDAHHEDVLGAHLDLAQALEGKSARMTLHRAARYAQGVYAHNQGLGGGFAIYECMESCAEAGLENDALMVRDLLEASGLPKNDLILFSAKRNMDLALAERYTKMSDFRRAYALLAPYPRDTEVLSKYIFLLAMQGDIDLATAIPRTSGVLNPSSGKYALKHAVLPAAQAMAPVDIAAALKMLSSVDKGWGNDWTGLKPDIEPSIERAYLYLAAGRSSEALAALQGVPITDLRDAISILQPLESITLAALQKQWCT